jgi:hypothetical protein
MDNSAAVKFYDSNKSKNSKQLKHEEIDHAVAGVLSECDSLYSVELKKRAEGLLDRSIPFPTFSAHIKRMLEQNELNKVDTGIRGKKSVSYSIMENARKKSKLKIFRGSPVKNELMGVYTKLLFFSIIENKIFKSKDLDTLLSDLGVSTNELVPDTIRYLDKGRGVFISNFITLDKESLPPPLIMKFASEDQLKIASASLVKPETMELPSDKKSSSYPKLQAVNTVGLDYDPFVSYEVIHKPIDGVIITEKEYDLGCFDPHFIPYKEYEVSIPGISISEFIANDLHNNNELPAREVREENFKCLEELGLINKCAKRIHKEYRYVIADNALSDFILDLRYILGLEHKIFDIEFRYFRNPASDERERLFLLYGKRAAKDMLNSARIARDRFRGGLIKNYADEKTISKALEILREVGEIRKRNLSEGIRKVKIKHTSTIQKYDYLREVIRIICPMLLQQ